MSYITRTMPMLQALIGGIFPDMAVFVAFQSDIRDTAKIGLACPAIPSTRYMARVAERPAVKETMTAEELR